MNSKNFGGGEQKRAEEGKNPILLLQMYYRSTKHNIECQNNMLKHAKGQYLLTNIIKHNFEIANSITNM